VKLQALVRGHIERKRTAQWLKRVQALLHTQAQVSAGLVLHASPSSSKFSTHLHVSITKFLSFYWRFKTIFIFYWFAPHSLVNLDMIMWFSNYHLQGPETPEKFESPISSKSMKYEQSPIFKVL